MLEEQRDGGAEADDRDDVLGAGFVPVSRGRQIEAVVERQRLGDRQPPHDVGAYALQRRIRQVHEPDAGRAQHPLVCAHRQDVDTRAGDVELERTNGLRAVDDEQHTAITAQAAECIEVVAVTV